MDRKNPNRLFSSVNGKSDVISVANLPDHFKIRDPAEYRMEAMEILAEMGICANCKDHTPCGCEEVDDCPNCREPAFDVDKRVCLSCDYDEKHDPNVQNFMGFDLEGKEKPCLNCGSPHLYPGKFCGKKCQAEFVGEV